MKQFLLIVFLSFFLLSPARGDIKFIGNIPHQKEILSIYSTLPERGKRQDVEVRECDDLEWRLVTDFTMPGVVGLYFPASAHLYLYKYNDNGKDYLPFVFTHEFGHHVFYRNFTQAEREKWTSFWESHKKLMPGDYARTSASEGFAEVYAYTYFSGKDKEEETLDPLVEYTMKSFFR